MKKILEVLVTPYHPLFLSLTYSTTLHSCLLWPHIYVALLMFLSWNCIPYSSTWLHLKETPRFASLMTPWKGNFSDLAFRFISFFCLHTDDDLQIKFWQLPMDRGRCYFYLNSTLNSHCQRLFVFTFFFSFLVIRDNALLLMFYLLCSLLVFGSFGLGFCLAPSLFSDMSSKDYWSVPTGWAQGIGMIPH